MNYFKRAWLSVVRRKSKSLILLVVVFILGNVIAGAFSIQQASKNVEKNIKHQLGALATVELDWELVDKESANNPDFSYDFQPITLDTIEKIAQSEYVRYYDYSISTNFYSKTLKRVEIEDYGDFMEEPFGTSLYANGVEYNELLDATEGKIEMTSGRVFKPEEIKEGKLVTIVSEEFARTNGLTVGDSMVLTSMIIDYARDTMPTEPIDSRDISVEIIGLFKPIKRETKTDTTNQLGGFDDNAWQLNELHNKIYLPNKVVIAEATYIFEGMMEISPDWQDESDFNIEEMLLRSTTPYFAIKDPESLEAFKSASQEYLPEYYKISTSADAYDAISGPVNSLDTMSRITLYVAIGASILILSLVIVLFLRDRKHELGIYLSLGDRRSSVLGQIVTEVVMVALVGLTLSLVSGNMIASNLSSSMMAKSQDNHDPFQDYIYVDPNLSNNITQDEVVDAYKVELTPQYIGLFYLIGLGVTIGSTIVPIVYITRLNPKKIMM